VAAGLSPSALALAAAAASASARVDGVVELDGGPMGSFSTYGEGRRCTGVTVTPQEGSLVVRIRLVARFGSLLPELGAAIRAEVERELRPMLGDQAVVVDVEITDLIAAPA
jgi:uncharacterized alkaline shock family protein YloU